MGRLRVLLLVSMALAGCGGDGGDAGADPATSLPPSGVYVELVVRPEGEQRERMTALASRVLGTDAPGVRIVELLEAFGADVPFGDYARDVEPWLGRRAGIVLTGAENDFAAAVAASDSGAAEDAVARLTKGAGGRPGSHREVDYWVDGRGDAFGAAGDFVLLAGSERAMRLAIDAQKGKSLAETERFKAAVTSLPEAREGSVYLDMVTLLQQDPDVGAGAGFLTLAGSGLPPAALAVLATPDDVAIESRRAAGGRGLGATILGRVGATPVLGELPGDAWVAAGAPRFGETLRQIVGGIGGPLGSAVIAGQLERDYGISLERDVYSWIGDVAVFARGTSPAGVGGGLVAGVEEPAAARRALPRLLGALQLQPGVTSRPVALPGASLAFEVAAADLPGPVFVALSERRLVVGYGRAATLAALDGGPALRDGDAWRRAEDALDGVDPALIVDVPAALVLAGQEAGGDPDFARATPYLETIGVLAGGSRTDGDRVRSRLVAGIAER